MSNRTRHSALLLTEIIIAILFFSLISAVCMQIFVKSHTLSKDTEDLDFAVQQTSSVAALLQAEAEPAALLDEHYPNMENGGDGSYIFYNKDYATCTKEDASYQLFIWPSSEEDLKLYHLEMQSMNGAMIYQVDITTYQPTGDA